MSTADPNSINLAEYRGATKRCPQCSSMSPAARLDLVASRAVCKMCLGRGFIAVCKNCNGTGLHTAGSVWDGGRSSHTSTCTPCGGSGVFATKRPEKLLLMEEVETVAQNAGLPAATKYLKDNDTGKVTPPRKIYTVSAEDYARIRKSIPGDQQSEEHCQLAQDLGYENFLWPVEDCWVVMTAETPAPAATSTVTA